MDDLHPMIERFGSPVELGQLTDRLAVQLAVYISEGLHPDAKLRRCFARSDGCGECVLLEMKAERPQDRAADIRRWEPILIGFSDGLREPNVLAARADFPHTAHQFAVPSHYPRSLCIDERPWDVARATWTPFSFLELIRKWLGAAVAGTLTGEGQAIEPRFFGVTQGIVLPRVALGAAPGGPLLTARLADPASRRLLIAQVVEGAPPNAPQFRVLTIVTDPQVSGVMALVPRNLEELVAEMTACDCDLMKAVRSVVLAAREMPGGCDAELVLVLVIPIQRKSGGPVEVNDIRAFVAPMSVGQIGCKLGLLDVAPETGMGFVRKLGHPGPVALADIPVDMLEVHFEFDRTLAAQCAGIGEVDGQRIVLIGAGAIGSHVAVTLAREGRYEWTVIDFDILLPHNMTRHALMPAEVGRQKAVALAAALNGLLGVGSAAAITADILDARDPTQVEGVKSVIGAANVVLDASASVSVARALSDRLEKARMASAFLNPAGTASVLLLEDSGRECRLDALEGQYYRLVLNDAGLLDHLALPASGYRYAGACRSTTNRIPDSSVAILGGLAARALPAALADTSAAIKIWSLNASGTVRLHVAPAARTRRSRLGAWTVLHDEMLRAKLSAMREVCLPAETGGVLVGIVDTARRVIVIVDALPAPEGSAGTEEGFERGTAGLAVSLSSVADRTGGQVRYIGEWHSHPAGCSTQPSIIDLEQLEYLRGEMRRDSLPALMMIAGTDSEVAVISLDGSEA